MYKYLHMYIFVDICISIHLCKYVHTYLNKISSHLDQGIPIRRVRAYDCSDTANSVYAANFDVEEKDLSMPMPTAIESIDMSMPIECPSSSSRGEKDLPMPIPMGSIDRSMPIESPSSSSRGGPAEAKGTLHRVLIDGLKLSDVEGLSDVWTMSPPCQPFTNTKGAHQLVIICTYSLSLTSTHCCITII